MLDWAVAPHWLKAATRGDFPLRRRCLLAGISLATLCQITGCNSNGFARIDNRVETLIAQASGDLGPDAHPPIADNSPLSRLESRQSWGGDGDPYSSRPATTNPPAHQLPAEAIRDADDVLERLEQHSLQEQAPLQIDLAAALAIATRQAREHQFAQEQYVLTALRLLIERHLWGPRFFNDVSATIVGQGDEGMFDTSLRLVNDLRVTQRLPYGGAVSARALARAAEDLHHRVTGEGTQSAEIILAADVPLLRGAGMVAREDLILAEREMVYAARDYEQFRRDLLFDITEDFLDLIVLQSAVENAQRQVIRLNEVEERELALFQAGRTPLFQAALAQQSKVAAVDALNNRQEVFRLAVDRFKIRIGLSPDQAVEIVPSDDALPVPQADVNEAVRLAMAYRLDLQTQRDLVDDARRSVAIARNQMLPDLNFSGSVSVPTDDRRARAGLRFEPDESNFRAGLTLGLPLDRQIERLSVREAQIRLERSLREYERLRDVIAVEVRAAVRDIDLARYTLEIQERNIQIGMDRVESIEAAPDRASARDASEAANELARARDRRDAAERDVKLAVLRYLLLSGQLRVSPDGRLILPPGLALQAGG